MSSDCMSIPDPQFFNQKYRYPDWFTRKKYLFHKKMLERLKKLRFLHSRSSQHYDKMSYIFTTPSIVITSLSGIASFLSTSQYIDADYQNAFGITVGVMASLSSIFQALSSACQFGVKREAHRTVAEQYNALIVKTKFEMEMPNEEDFIDNLESSILEIQSKCNYFIPQFILQEWTKKKALTGKPTQNSVNSNDNIEIYSSSDDANLKMNIQEDDDDSNNNLNKKSTTINKSTANEDTYLLSNTYARNTTRTKIKTKSVSSVDTQISSPHISINIENIKENKNTDYENLKGTSEDKSDTQTYTELESSKNKISNPNRNKSSTSL